METLQSNYDKHEFVALVSRLGLVAQRFHQTPHTGGTLYNPSQGAIATYWHKVGGSIDVTWLVKTIKQGAK